MWWYLKNAKYDTLDYGGLYDKFSPYFFSPLTYNDRITLLKSYNCGVALLNRCCCRISTFTTCNYQTYLNILSTRNEKIYPEGFMYTNVSEAGIQRCSYEKAVKQLYWNHTSAWVFSSKFTAYFQNTFC